MSCSAPSRMHQSSVRKSSLDGRRENEFAEWLDTARCSAGEPEPDVAAEVNEVVELLIPGPRGSAATGSSSLSPHRRTLRLHRWLMQTIAELTHGAPSRPSTDVHPLEHRTRTTPFSFCRSSSTRRTSPGSSDPISSESSSNPFRSRAVRTTRYIFVRPRPLAAALRFTAPSFSYLGRTNYIGIVRISGIYTVRKKWQSAPTGKNVCTAVTYNCTTDGASCRVLLRAVLPQNCCSARAVIGIG